MLWARPFQVSCPVFGHVLLALSAVVFTLMLIIWGNNALFKVFLCDEKYQLGKLTCMLTGLVEMITDI